MMRLLLRGFVKRLLKAAFWHAFFENAGEVLDWARDKPLWSALCCWLAMKIPEWVWVDLSLLWDLGALLLLIIVFYAISRWEPFVVPDGRRTAERIRSATTPARAGRLYTRFMAQPEKLFVNRVKYAYYCTMDLEGQEEFLDQDPDFRGYDAWLESLEE